MIKEEKNWGWSSLEISLSPWSLCIERLWATDSFRFSKEMLEYGSSMYVFMVILLKRNKNMLTVWGTWGLLQTDSFVTLTQWMIKWLNEWHTASVKSLQRANIQGIQTGKNNPLQATDYSALLLAPDRNQGVLMIILFILVNLSLTSIAISRKVQYFQPCPDLTGEFITHENIKKTQSRLYVELALILPFSYIFFFHFKFLGDFSPH